MADTLMRAGARTAVFGRPATLTSSPGALELAGHSPAITRVQELVRRAAPLDVGVLLTAERGADVDSVARELHGRSRRATAPYVVVECDG
ncbi:MAG TPA: sigma 54-interacting transcriptional regulator, partial [Vicinamibacterales bacterium]